MRAWILLALLSYIVATSAVKDVDNNLDLDLKKLDRETIKKALMAVLKRDQGAGGNHQNPPGGNHQNQAGGNPPKDKDDKSPPGGKKLSAIDHTLIEIVKAIRDDICKEGGAEEFIAEGFDNLDEFAHILKMYGIQSPDGREMFQKIKNKFFQADDTMETIFGYLYEETCAERDVEKIAADIKAACGLLPFDNEPVFHGGVVMTTLSHAYKRLCETKDGAKIDHDKFVSEAENRFDRLSEEFGEAWGIADLPKFEEIMINILTAYGGEDAAKRQYDDQQWYSEMLTGIYHEVCSGSHGFQTLFEGIEVAYSSNEQFKQLMQYAEAEFMKFFGDEEGPEPNHILKAMEDILCFGPPGFLDRHLRGHFFMIRFILGHSLKMENFEDLPDEQTMVDNLHAAYGNDPLTSEKRQLLTRLLRVLKARQESGSVLPGIIHKHVCNADDKQDAHQALVEGLIEAFGSEPEAVSAIEATFSDYLEEESDEGSD